MSGHNNSDDEHDEDCPLLFTEQNEVASRPGRGRGGAAPAPASSSASVNPRFEVDTTQPTTSIQVRLADSTKLIARMKLTRTVADLRGFIDAPAGRPYTIGTTFPTRVLDPAEGARTVKETGLGGVVVVPSWV
ncbi:hypothetical protein B0H14DRAFT_3871279 [Mycena olivaceomarginata]|nr:hypothetical protein B0H14DRAFT_3871279 [Mycena olivaceomarginata]